MKAHHHNYQPKEGCFRVNKVALLLDLIINSYENVYIQTNYHTGNMNVAIDLYSGVLNRNSPLLRNQ